LQAGTVIFIPHSDIIPHPEQAPLPVMASGKRCNPAALRHTGLPTLRAHHGTGNPRHARQEVDAASRQCGLAQDKARPIPYHIKPVCFPPYIASFNPIERLWQHLESDGLAGFITKHGDEPNEMLFLATGRILNCPVDGKAYTLNWSPR
jgi:transposase